MKNKKVAALVGALAVVAIGVSLFVFAPKDSVSTEVVQEVVEAVATPTIEIPEEVVEEPEVAEVPEEPVETPEVVEETTEVEETSEPEGSIVEVAETSEEVSEDVGVPTQTEEVKPVETQPEEVKPAETKPVETQPQQTTVDAQRDAILAQAYALGATDGIPESNFVIGNETSNVGLQWE